MIAVSTDDLETQKKFRDSLKAPFHFLADDKRAVVGAFDVKTFLLPIARRITFVVGPGRKVLSIQEGGDAIDPSGVVTSCSLQKPKALELIAPRDAGH